ncbi:TPA: hypothetical protein ACFPBF_000079 [Neisseria meningitidis]
MDQQPVIEIAEFPHDNKLWRIDGLGKIFSQLKNNNNLFIEVYLRPVNFHDNSVYNFAKFDSSGREIPEYNQLKKIPVNIGLLPILRVGSLWIKGKLQNNNAVTDIATLKNIEINANTVEIINSNYKIKYLDSSGREQECKLLLQKNFATDAKVPFSCFKIQNENYKNGIIIPVIEIIRFYYACSTRLAHLTFSNPDEITKISYAIDNETDKVVIKLPQQYTDQEAFILARILTSNIALSGLFQIKNSLIKIGVNEQPTTLLSTNFPFINPTNLMVRGIKIVDRFLVTEICSCSAPFPDISVDRNNDNRKGDKKTDIPDDKKKEYRRGGQTPSLKGNSTIQNQYESVNCVSTLQFNLNINCFSDLIGKKIEKPQKPFNEYKAQKLAINEKIFVPLTDSAHKAQWSYLVSKTKTRRKVLLGKIEYKDKTFWLIEIQARKSEHFVTAIIYFEAIDETKYLTQLLYVLAKQRGIWDKVPKNSSLQIITLKHTHKDIKSYAQKIHKKISNFILK